MLGATHVVVSMRGAGHRQDARPVSRSWNVLAWLAIGLAIVLAGCGGDPDPAAAWCGAFCNTVARCFRTSVSVDLRTCDPNCRDARPDLALRSGASAVAEQPCLEQLPCEIFNDEMAWQRETRACWDEAKAGIAPTLESRGFCRDYAQAWFECGYNLPLGDCERTFSMWNGALYDRLIPCESQTTCDGFTSCVEDVFGSLRL